MKLLKFLFIVTTVILFFYIYNYNQISVFRVRDIRINSDKIRNNLKITQISDFHSNHLIDLEKMTAEINRFNPDFIVLTGDIIDHNDTELGIILQLFKVIGKFDKDIYFVRGNHEANHMLYDDLRAEMEKLGIIILENNSRIITVNNEKINITGLNFYPKSREYEEITYYKEAIKDLNLDYYNVLLRHSPNNVEDILNGREDLILSGHSHAGQFRFPFIGAIVAPGQGFFPKYDKGIFRINDTILYIDSGLGNSVAPVRAFNPVQISNITIEPKK